jgi:LPS sulfotransferase NodH
MVHDQEAQIESFLRLNATQCRHVVYEDLADDPTGTVESIFGIHRPDDVPRREPILRPQRDATNDEFVNRLSSDILDGPVR